jgi:predicted XRE-type DNA-binding protein
MENQMYESVWDALEDTPEVAENMKIRSVLMMALQAQVRRWDGSQAEAANRIGVTQPRLNDLLRGRIDKFSLDALVNMVARAGLQVQVDVREVA